MFFFPMTLSFNEKKSGEKNSWQSRQPECSLNTQEQQNLAEANSIHLFLFNPAIDFYTASKLNTYSEAFDFGPAVLVLFKVMVLLYISGLFFFFVVWISYRISRPAWRGTMGSNDVSPGIISISS